MMSWKAPLNRKVSIFRAQIFCLLCPGPLVCTGLFLARWFLFSSASRGH